MRALLRAQVPHLDNDRHFHPDMEAAIALVRSGAVIEAAGAMRCRRSREIGHDDRLARRVDARRRAAARQPPAYRHAISPASGARPRLAVAARATMPTGGSTSSTTSPPISARPSSAPTISRTVIDVNRDPSGASLYPGQATTELCPTTTFDGEPLYRDGRGARTTAEIAERRARVFRALSCGARGRDRAAAGRTPRVVAL